jgi:hypothetical protein
MGLLSKALSFGGNLLNAGLNHLTGGAAGVIGSKALDLASKHAGVIGKVAGAIGKHVMTDEQRSHFSNIAEKAISALPQGKIKNTLTSISSSARGEKSDNSLVSSSPKYTKGIRKTSDSVISPAMNRGVINSRGKRGRGRG